MHILWQPRAYGKHLRFVSIDGITCWNMMSRFHMSLLLSHPSSDALFHLTISQVMEEAPGSYKNVDDVVDTCHAAGISKKMIRLRPVAVIKGVSTPPPHTHTHTPLAYLLWSARQSLNALSPQRPSRRCVDCPLLTVGFYILYILWLLHFPSAPREKSKRSWYS